MLTDFNISLGLGYVLALAAYYVSRALFPEKNALDFKRGLIFTTLVSVGIGLTHTSFMPEYDVSLKMMVAGLFANPLITFVRIRVRKFLNDEEQK